MPAWLRLVRIYNKIDLRSARHFRALGLTCAQFDVLAQVGVHEGITQGELAGLLFVTKGNISQILDRMEEQNLLKRCQEGRTKSLVLTDRGRALYAEAVPSQERLIDELFKVLAPEEQAQLTQLLRKLDHSLV